MFEALEKAARREANRLTPEDLKPTVVRNVGDIRRVVAEYDPATAKDGDPVTLQTIMRGVSEDDHGNPITRTYQVSAQTRSKSRRTILLEGFALLRRQIDARVTINEQARPVLVNGHEMLPPKLPDTDGAVFIDPLIRQWMGAERRGMFICWDPDDGFTYKYDIFAHKLSRAARETGDASAS